MTRKELSERLWDFAVRVGKVVDALPDTRLGKHIAGQLVRAGTSSAPNYDEGCNADSRADFIHKFKVALKELAETRGWLRFCTKADLLPGSRLAGLVDEAPFLGLNHIAIVVKDTDEALNFYRDTLRLPLVFSEVLEEQSVRLAHLDLGGAHLQLVQPLSDDHPLKEDLRQRGEGLHHLCFEVSSVPAAMESLPQRRLSPRDRTPRRGPCGRQAAFLDPANTRGVLFEITSWGASDEASCP